MTLHQYALIAVMAVVVIILRCIPFVLFSGKRKVPASLLYLGKVLTAAAIAMLVVYSLYGNLNYPTCGAKNLLPGLAAGKWKNILFCPTGALHSPTAAAQGESIPGISHAVAISKEG